MQNLVCLSYHVGVDNGSQELGPVKPRRLGLRGTVGPKTCLSLQWVTTPNLVVLGQTVCAYFLAPRARPLESGSVLDTVYSDSLRLAKDLVEKRHTCIQTDGRQAYWRISVYMGGWLVGWLVDV